MMTLEKNIPIPKKRENKTSFYSIMGAAEIGDSAVCPGKTISKSHLLSLYPGRKYTQRKVEGGIRVWRVK